MMGQETGALSGPDPPLRTDKVRKEKNLKGRNGPELSVHQRMGW